MNVINRVSFLVSFVFSFFRIVFRMAAGLPIISRKPNPEVEKAVQELEKTLMRIMGGPIAARMCVPIGSNHEHQRTCFHEAGHAFVAHYFGFPLDSAEVSPGVGGITRYGPQPAGAMESLAVSLSNTPMDESQLSEKVGAMIHCGQLPDLPDLENETAKILAGGWSQISRAARALYAKGKLSAAELEAMFA